MNVPTPYEVSRLAIALRGREAAKEPFEAIREALGLWFVAVHELEKAKEKEDPMHAAMIYDSSALFVEEMMIEEENRSKRAHEKKYPEIRFGISKEDSDAMKWLARQGTVFKTFRGFEKAWDRVFGADGPKLRERCTEEALRRFIHKERESALKADAERKKRKRRS